jgi:hypothetical protein
MAARIGADMISDIREVAVPRAFSQFAADGASKSRCAPRGTIWPIIAETQQITAASNEG